MQTHWVYRDAPTCPTGPTGPTGQTQASRPRRLHTTVAIKQAKLHLCGTSSPEPNQTAALQTLGVYRDAPILSDKSDRSDRSDLSVTPTQHAYPRCHQKSPAYLCGKSAPGYAPRIPPLPSRYPHTPTATLRPSHSTHCGKQTHGVYSGTPLPVSYR